MNNQMIGKCELCGQDYCMECSEHKEWEKFCSEECVKEWKDNQDGKKKEI